jgi:hypothetical protein
VSTCLDKIIAVLNWPIPGGVKELRSFLGLARYYTKFVKHFGMISRPLTDLLKNNTMFVWTSSPDIAFHTQDSTSSGPCIGSS